MSRLVQTVSVGSINNFSSFSCLYLRRYSLKKTCSSVLQDAAAAQHGSSDSGLSDYQPPAKRKYVLKNKANASVVTYNKGLFYFCQHLVPRHNNNNRFYIYHQYFTPFLICFGILHYRINYRKDQRERQNN